MCVGPSQVLPGAHSASALQLTLHAVAPQAYAPQGTGTSSLQVPRPLQIDGRVSTPRVQVACPQVTWEPTKPAHVVRSVPSHWAAEHGLAALPAAHAVRAPCGLPESGAHVPSASLMSQASHCPAHGALQQNPSTQRLFVHASFVVQACPFAAFFWHVPPEHHPSVSYTHLTLPTSDLV